jgi:DNA-binding NtrC family response regulator
MRSASGGTLFLDEVGALGPELQAKLLRSLQERSVRSVGANREVAADFRLVVSSQQPLDQLVRAGRMRPDLYYRLAVLEIHVPPLRDRELDTLLLARAFCAATAAHLDKRIVGFTPAFERALLRHTWPGNVRELANAIEYAVAFARFDHTSVEDLPPSVRPATAAEPLEEARWETTERRHIVRVLTAMAGNRSRAAEQLGIDRKTLLRKMNRYGIDVPPASRSGTRPKVTLPPTRGRIASASGKE